MPRLHSDSPETFRNAVGLLETFADRCEEEMQLSSLPGNYAAWLSMTQAISWAENNVGVTGYGSSRHRHVVIHAGRALAQMLRWTMASRETIALSRFRWSPANASAASHDFNIAAAYSLFCAFFPGWWKSLLAVELRAPAIVQFSFPESVQLDRVAAFESGLRNPDWPIKERPVGMLVDRSATMEGLFERLISGARPRGRFGVAFDHKELKAAYLLLNEVFKKRLELLYRRANLDLGHYTLEEFRLFYAAFLGICSVHDHLNVRRTWTGKYPYPIESAVLTASRNWWIESIVDLSRIPKETSEKILDDLTFRPLPRFLDLQVAPFVPLNEHRTEFAVAPPFVLASDSEENALRTCSWRRKSAHDALSNTKEEEMRDSLLSLRHYDRKVQITGPHTVAKGLPDIDLLIEHPAMRLALICELKWARRPVSTFERAERNAELEKGVRQLNALRNFLEKQAEDLDSKQILSANFGEYQLAFVLLARDHLYWSDGWSGISLIDYNIFVPLLESDERFEKDIRRALNHEWLPTYARDYSYSWTKAVAGQVAIEFKSYRSSETKITNHL